MKTRKPSFYETLGILLLAAGTAVAADNGGGTSAKPVHQPARATVVETQYAFPAPHTNILTGEIIR
jgi:hypothetical protein